MEQADTTAKGGAETERTDHKDQEHEGRRQCSTQNSAAQLRKLEGEECQQETARDPEQGGKKVSGIDARMFAFSAITFQTTAFWT